MESITIYPENEKQESLIKSLLKEMKIRFKIAKQNDDTLLSEKDFYNKINKSIKQVEEGRSIKLSKEQQKDFLGL